MARINIEDKLHAEKEFKRLVRNLGDEDKAVGLLYRFWREAQDYWGEECALMSKAEFLADGFGPILEAGLAEERPEGIYALGAEARFSWYLQRQRASEKAIKARSGQPKQNPGTPDPKNIPVPDNPLTLSPSPALSPSPVQIQIQGEDSNSLKSEIPKSGEPLAGVKGCKQAWLGTLDYFGVGRPLMPTEEVEIGRAIVKYTAANVELALYGARWEPKTEGFDPKKFISIGRILTRDKDGKERIDRFVSYGIEARQKEAQREANRRQQQRDPEPSEDEYTTDPGRVREIMAGLFPGLKGQAS